MSLDQLFDQFLRERTYVHNVTPKTRDWYQSAWQAFKHSQPNTPTEITKPDLLAFVVHLRERGVKPVSCNTWLRAMNAFCRWLHEQGEATTLVKLRPQRLEKRIIRTHDAAALRVVLSYRPKTFEHWRVHALILTILDTGCRISQHMPGGDEGTADMSAALTGCQYIRDQLDTTVLVMHHPTKAEDTNERGGSGFRGGCADVLGIEEKPKDVFWLKSLNTRDRGKDLTLPYELEVVTLQGKRFRDEDGEQFTSCVPKALNAGVERVKVQRHDAETDAAVLRALTTTWQSARSIREKAERNDKAVRESLARLKGRGAADGDKKRGWALAA